MCFPHMLWTQVCIHTVQAEQENKIVDYAVPVKPIQVMSCKIQVVTSSPISKQIFVYNLCIALKSRLPLTYSSHEKEVPAGSLLLSKV